MKLEGTAGKVVKVAAIDDAAYAQLFKTEYPEAKGDVKTGACAFNTARLADYLEKQGVPRSDMRLLYILASSNATVPLHPNMEILRDEERGAAPADAVKRWGYHAALMLKDNHVYDLSLVKAHQGMGIKAYMAKMFAGVDGNFDQQIRSFIMPLELLDEITVHGRRISGELMQQARMAGRMDEHEPQAMKSVDEKWWLTNTQRP